MPFILDLTGNYHNGIIYNRENPAARVFQYLDENSPPAELSKYLKYADDTNLMKKLLSLPISNPHISNFADFNGDCKPDLLLSSHNITSKMLYFEFWVNIGNAEYKLKKAFEFYQEKPEQISQFVISDFGISFLKSNINRA